MNKSNGRCRLLNLPPELRNEIYSYTLTSPEGLRWDHRIRRLRGAISPAILYTCRQIRAEAIGLPLRINKVVLDKMGFSGIRADSSSSAAQPNTSIHLARGIYLACDLENLRILPRLDDRLRGPNGTSPYLGFFAGLEDALSRLRMLELVDGQVLHAIPGTYNAQRMFEPLRALRAVNPLIKVRYVIVFGAVFNSFHQSPFWSDLSNLLAADPYVSPITVEFAGLEQWGEWVSRESNSAIANMAGFSRLVRRYAAAAGRIEDLQRARKMEGIPANTASSR